MRTDVKLGLVGSIVIVVVAVWYLSGNQSPAPEIVIGYDPIADQRTPTTLSGGSKQVPPNRPDSLPTKPIDPPREQPAPKDALSDLFATDDEATTNDQKKISQADPSPSDLMHDATEVSRIGAGGATGAAAVDADDGNEPVLGAPTRDVAVARPTPPSRPVVETHTVSSGETLESLARIYYGDAGYAALLRGANPGLGAADSSLAIGTKVVIPPEAGFVPPKKLEPVKSAAEQIRRNEGFARSGTYTVQRGDTLYAIARDKLGAETRWNDIYRLNKTLIGEDPGRLVVGQVLTLPGD